MDEIDVLAGHTLDGLPVRLWTQRSAWTNKRESLLSIGTDTYRLARMHPELLPALMASLRVHPPAESQFGVPA